MALVTETGAGLPNSNSYISITDADAYFADRGNAVWDAFDNSDNKTPALIKATDFMLQMYRIRWQGYRFLTTQALDWPRAYVPTPDQIGYGFGYALYYSTNVIPNEIKTACAELALRAATSTTGELAPDLTPDDYIKLARVGPISVEYSAYRPLISLFRSVEARLAPFLVGSMGTARVIRA